jgi:hypothetical protein
VVLGKGEQKKIPFSIKVPKGAEAGGHFAAIFLSTAPPSTKGGQVSVGAKIGVLVLLRVSGDIKEGGGVLDFKTLENQSFFTSLPVNFSYRFQNSGNDRVNPSGTIQINNSFGLKSDVVDANPAKGNILPQSIRRFDVVWGQDVNSLKEGFVESLKAQFKHFAFGFYTAHLELIYGTNGTTSLSKTFFVFPWQLLLVSFFILGFGFIILRQIIVRYNRWIIQKAQQNIVQK